MPLKGVLTVSGPGLRDVSAELLSRMRDVGFAPEVVVGIATGGVRVVEAMEVDESIAVFTCRLRRASTQTKERSRSGHILRALPRRVADGLRVVEDWFGARRPVLPVQAPDLLVQELTAVADHVRAHGLQRVAVVDDAVDSGATLACVMDTLRGLLPRGVDLRSAVVTQTRPEESRLVGADFSLYELVLVRFPWSLDYRGRS